MNMRVLMRALRSAGVVAVLMAYGGILAARVGAAQDSGVVVPPGATTIWSGVFTDAQAQRGEKAYVEKCSYCHRADLSGGEVGPPLKGVPFLIRWEGKIGNLYFKIGNTMPQDKPATLEGSTVVDMLAFMLKMNGLPSGKAELEPSESLERIFVVRNAPGP